MARVHLLAPDPSFNPHEWWNGYWILQRSFAVSAHKTHTLTESAQKADVIIVCGPVRNSMLPICLLRNRALRANWRRSVWLSVADYALPILPGFYTSLRNCDADTRVHAGGVYVHTAERVPLDPFPVSGTISHLFSFVGNYRTNRLRQAIGSISDPRGFILDSGTGPDRRNELHEPYSAFRERYVASLRSSKFILCPRGVCPSSIRLFETMKAGRVPVIISDDWLRPSGIPWEDFCIFIKEKDIFGVPAVLAERENDFHRMSAIARAEWEKNFSIQNIAQTLADRSLGLLETDSPWAACLPACLKKMSWEFWVKGIGPAILRK